MGKSRAWSHPFCPPASAGSHLVPVHRDGREGQGGDVEGAVLGKPADVAHPLPEYPRAVHEASLEPECC